MNILTTPDELRCPSHRYPAHHRGPNLEQVCHEYLVEHDVATDCIYLPIYWTNNYFQQGRTSGVPGYQSVPAVQKFLDGLDRDLHYVTVVQCADGIYERLPENVTVFGAGGVGDVPLPLLCAAHSPLPLQADLLASFVGSVECGGPEAGVTGRSSWNPDGIGAQIRRRMMEVFSGHYGVVLKNQGGGLPADTTTFRVMMARSRFALCPRGYGRTSFRLYEAIQMGCVPVYIYDELWLPYQDVLDWTEFAVLCRWEDLEGLPDWLEGIHDNWWPQAQARLRELMPDYFTFEGLGRQLARMIGDLT